jgi:hypothetical protein
MYLTRGAGTGILFISSNSFESAGSISLLFEVEASASPPWAANTTTVETYDFRPTVNNGYVFYCVQAGTTGTVEPTWPTVSGTLVNDGTVVWIAFTDSQYFAKISVNGNQFAEDPVANIRIAGGNLIKLPFINGNQFIVGAGSIGVDLVSCVSAQVSDNGFHWDHAGTGGTGIQISAGGCVLPEVPSTNIFKNIATPVNDLSGRIGGLVRSLPAATGWSNAPASVAPAQVIRTRVSNADIVKLSGCVSNGSADASAGGTVVAVIPYGFCPSTDRYFLAPVLTASGVQIAQMTVAANGNVSILTSVLNAGGATQTVTWLSLEGIEFPAPPVA